MATKSQPLSPSWLSPRARGSRESPEALRMSHARGSHGWFRDRDAA